MQEELEEIWRWIPNERYKKVISNFGTIKDVWGSKPDVVELKTSYLNGKVCFLNSRKQHSVHSLVRSLFPKEFIPENIEESIMDNYKRYLSEDLEKLANKKFYEIDGIVYRSLNEAKRALDIPIGTIKSRLESKNFNSYKYI